MMRFARVTASNQMLGLHMQILCMCNRGKSPTRMISKTCVALANSSDFLLECMPYV